MMNIPLQDAQNESMHIAIMSIANEVYHNLPLGMAEVSGGRPVDVELRREGRGKTLAVGELNTCSLPRDDCNSASKPQSELMSKARSK